MIHPNSHNSSSHQQQGHSKGSTTTKTEPYHLPLPPHYYDNNFEGLFDFDNRHVIGNAQIPSSSISPTTTIIEPIPNPIQAHVQSQQQPQQQPQQPQQPQFQIVMNPQEGIRNLDYIVTTSNSETTSLDYFQERNDDTATITTNSYQSQLDLSHKLQQQLLMKYSNQYQRQQTQKPQQQEHYNHNTITTSLISQYLLSKDTPSSSSLCLSNNTSSSCTIVTNDTNNSYEYAYTPSTKTSSSSLSSKMEMIDYSMNVNETNSVPIIPSTSIKKNSKKRSLDDQQEQELQHQQQLQGINVNSTKKVQVSNTNCYVKVVSSNIPEKKIKVSSIVFVLIVPYHHVFQYTMVFTILFFPLF